MKRTSTIKTDTGVTVTVSLDCTGFTTGEVKRAMSSINDAIMLALSSDQIHFVCSNLSSMRISLGRSR